MTTGEVLLPAIGAPMMTLAFYDAFRTLFFPEGRGALNNLLARAGWKVFTAIGHRIDDTDRRHRFMRLAGPVIFILITTSWATLVTIGFALVYLPFLPEELRIASGLESGEQSGFFDAVYLSFSSLSSTGFGDISPKAEPLRMVVIAEGVSGAVLLGLGLSWLLSLYPAIGRRRTTAETIAVHQRADFDPATAEPAFARGRVLALSDRILEVSRDLAKFPILYYFMETRTEASLPRQIGAPEWGQARAAGAEDDSLNQAAALLDGAMASLRTTLRDRFFPAIEDEEGDVLDRFREDHLISDEEAVTTETDHGKTEEVESKEG